MPKVDVARPVAEEPALPPDARVWVSVILVQVAFGSLSVAGKFALVALAPSAVAAVRVASAAVIFIALTHVVKGGLRPFPPARDLGAFAGFSLLGVVLNQLLFVEGLARTTAINATLLVTTIPAWTLLVALALRRESFNARRLAGVGLGLSGVVLLLGLDALALGGANLVGNVLVVTNALSYSVFLVLSRPYVRRYDPLVVTAWTFLFGTGFMLVLAAPALAVTDFHAVPEEAWMALLWIVGVSTVAAYGLSNWTLRFLDSSAVAAFIPLQPVVAAVLAITLLDEALTPRVVVAGAIIVAGVVVAARAARSRRAGKNV